VTTSKLDAFTVTPMNLATDPYTETTGLPTFSASIAGISSKSPYYYIDFTADSTIVWDSSCT